MLRSSLTKSIACMAFVSLGMSAEAETRIASWNIKHLGWGDEKDYGSLAEVGRYFSLIAVQEVMDEDAVYTMEKALEQRTGVAWEVLVSGLSGRGSYKESHAFLWRSDSVTWIDGALTYLDDRDAFARDPFSARFQTYDGFTFVMSSAHLIYGDSIEVREEEVGALRSYLAWLDETFQGTPVFMTGDFNLPPSNDAWGGIADIAYPLIQDQNTTLSTHDGKFANLYDNIWVPTGVDLPLTNWGVLKFPSDVLGITHIEARESVSDHAPVYVGLQADVDNRSFDSFDF